MKSKLLFLIFVLFVVNPTNFWAQTNGFNYKSLIYINGAVVSNQSVTLRFTYFDGATQVYQETFTTTTSNGGIVTLNMGEGTVVSGNFNTIDFSHIISYKVEVNVGAGYTNMGTYDFKSVPNAKHAQTATSLTNSLSINGLSDAKTDVSSLFLGDFVGSADDGGNYNVGVGQNNLMSNTSGFNNVAVGTGTLTANTTGGQNTALGSNALFANQTASGNTAVGYASMNASNGGLYNTALGYASLMQNATGSYNVALGDNALKSNTTAHYNTAIGNGAGFNNSVGNLNVFLGNNAGYNETGSSKLYIDNSSTASPLIYGDFATNELTINGSLKIKDGTQGAGKVFTSDANGQGTWQAVNKTHTLILSTAEVQPTYSSTSFFRGAFTFYITTNNSTTVNIPLRLPVGAVINSITYYYVDDATADVRYRLQKSTMEGATSYFFLHTSSSTSADVRNSTVTGNLTILDDNIYCVLIDANNGAWPGDWTLAIRGVKVVYTY